MKIVKRDGRTVDYVPDKIRIAIGKANKEVADSLKISDEKIEEIILYIESLNKKRMLVEDIQDIIEYKLMEYGAFQLAKKYIIYRYRRSVIRQSNTTDSSILSIMKNGGESSGQYLSANRQRDVLASEVSKDLAYRLLLPKNVVEADKEDRIKFSYINHFTESIVESVKIDLDKMLENGTVINGVKIDVPKSFQSACNVLVEIVTSLCFCQTGAIYVELKDLFKYYELTYKKKYDMYESLMKNSLIIEQIRALAETQSFLEVKTGIQTVFYQLNTIALPDGSSPIVYFLIDLETISSPHDEKVVFEFIREKVLGLKDKDGEQVLTSIPGIVITTDLDSETGARYDYILKELTDSKAGYIGMSRKRYLEFLDEIDKFNQGSMVLNLAKLAIDFPNYEDFKMALSDHMSFCYEGFLCRNHNLQGVLSDKSPMHWQYGAIANLPSGERIDEYLKKDKSFMRLDVIGFEACYKLLEISEAEKREIRDLISDTIKKWNKENSFEIVLSNYVSYKKMEIFFSQIEDNLKKAGISSYYDSFEFMKEDYFKAGFIYCVKNDEEPDEQNPLSDYISVKE